MLFALLMYLLWLFSFKGGSAKDLTTANILLAGATAGFAFWSVALPLDTIKSKIQTDV